MDPSDSEEGEEEEEEKKQARPKRLLGLRDCARCLINRRRSLVQKLGRLPFPVGTIVRQADRLLDPLAHRLDGCILCILSSIDHKICAASTHVKGLVMDAPAKIYRRGLLGASADIWVHYGPSIKQEVQRAIHCASRVPLLNLVIPVFCAILAPMTVSMWLVKKSVIDGIAQSFLCEDLSKTQTSEPGQEFVMSELHSPTVVDEPFVKNETKEEVVEDETKEEVKDSFESVSEAVSLPQQEEDSPTVVDKPFVENETEEDVRGSDESASETVSLPQQEEEYVPDVLEMIDSSWSLGVSAFALPTRASSSSQSSSSASSSNSPWVRRIFKVD